MSQFTCVYTTGVYDCTATSCGSLDWYPSVGPLQDFVKWGTVFCLDGTKTSSLTPPICACPLYVADIAPCVCRPDTIESLTIDCSSKNIGSDRMATIISNISITTPVVSLLLNGNQLTKVPPGLTKFTLMNTLSLANNQISSIAAGDLSLVAKMESLDLTNNAITTIATNSLPSISRHYSN